MEAVAIIPMMNKMVIINVKVAIDNPMIAQTLPAFRLLNELSAYFDGF